VSALAEALVAAQAELPCAITKDADGQIRNRTYRYLTLDKLIEQTRPILTKHGLAIIQAPMATERGDSFVPMLRTTLKHVSGEETSSQTPLYLAEPYRVGNDAPVEAEYER
jgi:ERF superfamily